MLSLEPWNLFEPSNGNMLCQKKSYLRSCQRPAAKRQPICIIDKFQKLLGPTRHKIYGLKIIEDFWNGMQELDCILWLIEYWERVDCSWHRRSRKLLYWANRLFFYSTQSSHIRWRGNCIVWKSFYIAISCGFSLLMLQRLKVFPS